MKYAILAVLCLATSVFGAIVYDAPSKTLTYGAASDLSTSVDPAGGQNLTDTAAMMGNLTKDAFNALAGLQVIGFNGGPDARQGTTSINATYDATHVLTLNNFGNPTGYNYTGGWSAGRNQYSGSNAYDQFGTVGGAAGAAGTYHLPTDGPGLNWFAASMSASDPNAGVSAIGFVVDGRSDQTTPVGQIWVTLSDASEVSFPYVTFGGGDAGVPPGIGFFYQAPAGKFVTRVECTRDNGSGNSFTALDDLGFVVTPEPASMILLAVGGLAMLRRRK